VQKVLNPSARINLYLKIKCRTVFNIQIKRTRAQKQFVGFATKPPPHAGQDGLWFMGISFCTLVGSPAHSRHCGAPLVTAAKAGAPFASGIADQVRNDMLRPQ
jgi:hypothetical protein